MDFDLELFNLIFDVLNGLTLNTEVFDGPAENASGTAQTAEMIILAWGKARNLCCSAEQNSP